MFYGWELRQREWFVPGDSKKLWAIWGASIKQSRVTAVGAVGACSLGCLQATVFSLNLLSRPAVQSGARRRQKVSLSFPFPLLPPTAGDGQLTRHFVCKAEEESHPAPSLGIAFSSCWFLSLWGFMLWYCKVGRTGVRWEKVYMDAELALTVPCIDVLVQHEKWLAQITLSLWRDVLEQCELGDIAPWSRHSLHLMWCRWGRTSK